MILSLDRNRHSMICYIYRSTQRAEMYLYIIKKDDFSVVPEQLLKVFGRPDFSMLLNLNKRHKLARVDIALVSEKLTAEGYYLQMPPSVLEDQNYLSQSHASS